MEREEHLDSGTHAHSFSGPATLTFALLDPGSQSRQGARYLEVYYMHQMW